MSLEDFERRKLILQNASKLAEEMIAEQRQKWGEWREAAYATGIYPDGADVSTPEKFVKEQDHAIYCIKYALACKNREIEELNKQFISLRSALQKCALVEGAWESRCSLCGAETEVGTIRHKCGCPFTYL